MFRRLALPLALFALTALSACSSLPWGKRFPLDGPAEVPGAIAAARTDFEAGRTGDALDRMRSARDVEGLDVDTRDEVEGLVERYAAKRIEELSAPGADPAELAELAELDLPQQLAVSAGLLAARRYLEQDEPYDAYRTLQELESAFPRHHGRAEASSILVDAGLQLARSDGGWWLWKDRDDGVAVLEFLVLTYPSERRCDEAFFELAKLYEQDREFALAIQRHEELIFSHIDSPLAAESQADIPRLRLTALESPEYDRRELIRARSELEAWLGAHPGHAHEPEVRLDYADCLARLVRSDLGIARFYQRVSQPYGARYHAARGLAVAREAGDSALASEAERLLAALPEVLELPGQVRSPGDEAFSHDAAELQGALERTRAADSQPKPQPEVKP